MKIRFLLRQAFDRMPSRFQSLIVRIYGRWPDTGESVVSREGDIFEHRFNDISLFAPMPFLDSPQEMSDLTLDVFCWGYRPKAGDIVIDVGAGIGSEAFTFSRLVGEEGLVICVEPHPLIASCLKRNLDKNGIRNTRVEQVALAEKAEVIHMGNSINEWVANSIVSPGEEIVEVEGISFEDLLNRNAIQGRKIDLVKMNIEGAEWPVLQSMVGSLERIQNLAVSCHDFRGQLTGNSEFRTYMYVSEFLRNHGFHVTTRADSRLYVADLVYASRS